MKNPKMLVLLPCLLFSACGGAPPRPVAVYYPQDQVMNCAQLTSELGRINNEILAAYESQIATEDGNALLSVGAVLFFPPALFALDASGAEVVEINALQERGKALTYISKVKGCKEIPVMVELPDPKERGYWDPSDPYYEDNDSIKATTGGF